MKTSYFFHFLLFLIILSFNDLLANDFKIGDVSKKELKMTSYDVDPDAPAVILRDKGNVYFRITSRGGVEVNHERHVRIKILSKEGYDKADFKIPLYDYNNREDKINNFKAYTFNLENGKITKERLRKRDIIYDDASRYWDYAHFSMPKVKVGSIIDVEYKVTHSNSFAIDDWYFQHDIPVLHSEFKVSIPEWFQFNRTVRGYEKVNSKPIKNSFETLYIRENRVTVNSDIHSFSADTVPAFIEEPYMTTKDNFITKVSFELQSTNLPNSFVKLYTQSWATVSKELLDHPQFGREINKNHLKKEAKAIMSQAAGDKERLLLARDKIQSMIKYNGHDDLLPFYHKLKISLKEKSGNAADMNLNLIALLRKMNIDAEPVVLSTRQHGIIHPAHASIESLNYVLAIVSLEDQQYLVDATDPYLPLGQVPFKCLNGKGIILDKENPKLLPLHSNEEYSQTVAMMIDFSADTVVGDMITSYSGYFASQKWKDYIEKGEEKYFEDLDTKYDDWTISEAEMEWTSDYTLEERNKLEKSSVDQNIAGTLYLNAIFGNHVDENPFKMKERKYPIDFGCPHRYNHQIIIKLPPDYKLESVPETTHVKLPDDQGFFKYITSSMGNQLVITSELHINKRIFDQLEYPLVKELFQYAVDKYSEKLVLKEK